MAADRQTLLARARDEFAQGRSAHSRALCSEILAHTPDDAEALHLLAILELAAGNPAAARAPIERSLAHGARDATKHQTHGLVLRAQGSRAQAAAAFREALRLSPAFPEANASLALALMEEGDFAAAARHFERALAARPAVYPWQLNLGLARTRLGDSAGAIDAFQRAVQLNAGAAEAHNNLGTAFLAAGRMAEAEASFRRSIALAPAHSHAWTNLGNALRRAGRAREAEDAYRGATQRDPPLAGAWVNLGNALKDAGRLDEAMQCFARADAIDPVSPESHLSRAIACMLAGELERGFEEYRWRFGAPPDTGARERLHEAIRAGRTIEIDGEQGLGDALFFLRWAPALRAARARLSFRGDARLFPLLERAAIFEHFVPASAGAQDALVVPGGDLPWLTHGMAETHPPAFPLEAAPASLEAAGSFLQSAGPPPYIGVAWRAGLPSTGSAEHLHKMVPLEALGAALRQVPGTIVSLQRGVEAGELARLRASAARPVADAESLNADLDAMLGLVASLDDYAGVSSTNVHLRAGLAMPARVLVPLPPEWRSGLSGPGTPWFPAFRLYREDREGGWHGALQALGADLAGAGRR